MLLAGLIASSCQKSRPAAVVQKSSAEEASASAQPVPRPHYAGTYTNQDSTDCDLAITILEKENQYFFVKDKIRGTVKVTKQDSSTYLTFVGLKNIYPEEADIEALWQDSVLLVQNYGNAMNEYERFNCEAKYLELRRQP